MYLCAIESMRMLVVQPARAAQHRMTCSVAFCLVFGVLCEESANAV